MPPCPIAMPSSTAIVLNSRGTAPAARTASAMTWPTSRRCTCPGTNSVKLLATATIGLPMSLRATPVARSRARAPAMFLPCVTVLDRSGGMGNSPRGGESLSVAAHPGSGRRVWPQGLQRGPAAGSALGPEHLVGGRVEPLDVGRGQPRRPGSFRVLAQVLAQPVSAEHVHIPDRRDPPRDRGAVNGHRRADDDGLAERVAE